MALVQKLHNYFMGMGKGEGLRGLGSSTCDAGSKLKFRYHTAFPSNTKVNPMKAGGLIAPALSSDGYFSLK